MYLQTPSVSETLKCHLTNMGRAQTRRHAQRFQLSNYS